MTSIIVTAYLYMSSFLLMMAVGAPSSEAGDDQFSSIPGLEKLAKREADRRAYLMRTTPKPSPDQPESRISSTELTRMLSSEKPVDNAAALFQLVNRPEFENRAQIAIEFYSRSNDINIRNAAIFLLVYLKDPAGVPSILDALETPNKISMGDLNRVWQDLGSWGSRDERIREFVLKKINAKNGLTAQNSPEELQIDAGLEYLRNFYGRESRSIFIGYLKNPNPFLRRQALMSLVQPEDKDENLGFLHKALSTEIPANSRFVIEALKSYADPSSIEPIVKFVHNDVSPQLLDNVDMVSQLLTKIKDQRVIPALMEIARNYPTQLSFVAIVQISPAEAAKNLQPFLDSEYEIIRAYASNSLARFGKIEAFSVFNTLAPYSQIGVVRSFLKIDPPLSLQKSLKSARWRRLEAYLNIAFEEGKPEFINIMNSLIGTESIAYENDFQFRELWKKYNSASAAPISKKQIYESLCSFSISLIPETSNFFMDFIKSTPYADLPSPEVFELWGSSALSLVPEFLELLKTRTEPKDRKAIITAIEAIGRSAGWLNLEKVLRPHKSLPLPDLPLEFHTLFAPPPLELVKTFAFYADHPQTDYYMSTLIPVTLDDSKGGQELVVDLLTYFIRRFEYYDRNIQNKIRYFALEIYDRPAYQGGITDENLAILMSTMISTRKEWEELKPLWEKIAH